ncbi:phosphatase PAP2 family protein [Streptomyces sp. NBC_01198]|uniref:phosphatase PAP2 family protein n=1 Tax=Streptomyces sp. NBC_01198 TaxID=2903769 RepID=UPI002E1263C8|nr:phosphatase PAP2 family protein [Streptomyces sp. NBC_01198]
MTGRFDAGAYRWVTELAQRAPHAVDEAVRLFSDYGLGVFAVMMLVVWWRARSADAGTMAAALCVPLVVVAVYLVNDGVKSVFAEQRPCRTLHVVTVEACPPLGDYSFPSNHSALAAAAAVALALAAPRVGLAAVPVAVLMAASRVWIGVHYPHDVLAALLLGALLAWPLALASRQAAAPVVLRLRETRLRALLAGADARRVAQ